MHLCDVAVKPIAQIREKKMFDLLPTILSKTIDIIIKRSDMKRNSAAPLRLYELYICMLKIIDSAHKIRKELLDVSKDERHIPHIAVAVKNQSENLGEFTNLLFGISHYIQIYDRETIDELSDLLGKKYTVIWFYCDYFLKIDSSWLTLRRAKKGKKNIEGAVKSLKEQRYLSSVRGRMPFPPENPFLEEILLSLSDPNDLEMLAMAAEDDISALETCAESLASFIRSNCEFFELFPKTRGGRRT